MPLVWSGIDYAACRRGSDLIDYGDGQDILWHRCEMTACENGVCIGLSKSLCYPHGLELGAFTKEQFDAERNSWRIT